LAWSASLPLPLRGGEGRGEGAGWWYCQDGPESSPKAEIRRPKRVGTCAFRISGFGLLSGFGFRVSGFTLALLASCALALAKPPARVAQLTAILTSAAPQKEKADACRELARIGTKDAIAPLAALLADEQLSHMGCYGLETIPSSAVDKAFRDALEQLHGRLLAGVIGSIGVRRDTAAVKPLAKRLRDADPEVVQATARALGRIGTPAAARALEAALPETPAANQLAFCEGLFRCAETLAAKGDRKAALAIYDHLRALQLPHQARVAAWRGAILTRGQDGLPLLLKAVATDDFALFEGAMRIALELPGTNVTRALATQLKWLTPDKQILLAKALGRRWDPAAVPDLTATARKADKAVRVAAIRALPEIGDPAAVPALVELLGDSEAEVAKAAQEALAAIPGKAADTAVMTMFSRGPVTRRITAMDLIVRRRMTAAMPQLFRAAEDLEPKIRLAALKELSELAGPSDLPPLLDLMGRTKSPEDVEAVEQTLSAVSVRAADPDTCARKVATWFPRARPAQKCALVRVLTAIGGPTALKTVRASLGSSETGVRVAAIRALSNWTSADAAPDLLELARTGTDANDELLCVRGYLRFAGQSDLAVEKRLAMCRQAKDLTLRDGEKKLLLSALGGINSAESLELIKPHLEASVKDEASTAFLNVAEQLLKAKDAAKLAPKMIEPLETIGRSSANADLAKRAKALAEEAKRKSERQS
jgi:HEAT repeat protein